MSKMEEFRVVWQREGCNVRRKRYATRRGAERFMTLLGPEPWLAFCERDPDTYFCCDGREGCGCGGATIREESEAKREEMPPVAWVRLEKRTVPEWEATTYTLPTAAPEGDE